MSSPEFGLSDRQKEALIERQGAEVVLLRDRRDSLAGALRRIIEHRPLDLALVAFCQAALDGTATFSTNGDFDRSES